MNTHSLYPHHEDMEWLAIDRDGFVGRFTTGGHGPVPRCVLIREKDHRALIDIVDQHAAKSAVEVVGRVANPQDFRSCAERGVFAYDWSDVHRVAAKEICSYELMARPVAPLTFAWIQETVRDAEQLLPRIVLSFKESPLVPAVPEIDWIFP